MKKISLQNLLAILICAFTLTASAQNFNLLKDINTSKDGNPTNNIDNLYIGFSGQYFFDNYPTTPKYAVFNGIAYFTADDGIHGTELWRSDNTTAGTYMVKDITAGSAGTNIQSITATNNKLYFTAETIVYESDGTDAGTFPVPGITYNGDQTTCLTPVGNTLYFITAVNRLWKTDGTLAGTSLIIDFRQVFNYSKDFLGQLTNVNGTLFFTTGQDDIYGPELWKSDGTQAGTVLVKDIYPGVTGSRPGNLTAVNGKLYFSSNDGIGVHLWVSDGTEAGTYAVANENGAVLKQDYVSYGNTYIDAAPFAVVQKTIYFKAGTADKGFELYKCNTANISSGVNLVKNIMPGALGSNPANITAIDNTIFFSITDAANEEELWKTDGTNLGTVVLKFFGQPVQNIFSDFVAANGKLLFACCGDVEGNELWSSDGTGNGTFVIKDIYPGNHGSSPHAITYTGNNTSLFSANDGSKGIELWKTDGTLSGTMLVKNINVTTTASSNPDLSKTAYLKNNFYFSAYDPVYGNAPYKSDGTSAGTRLLKDIFPGSTSYTTDFTSFKNSVYFAAGNGGYTTIYKTDGTSKGTTRVFNSEEKYATVQGIYAGNKNLFVFYYDPIDSISELWATDGTTEGSYKIQDIYTSPVEYNGSFYGAVAVNNTIYFSGYDVTHGQELWKATSAAGSAKLVTDIFTGTANSNPGGLIAFNDKVCFQATDHTNTSQIYISDGTKTGTIKLYEGNAPIAHTNNSIFFAGYNDVTGMELYISDGTIAGTTLLKDIYPGVYNSNPSQLISADSIIYFQATDDTHGGELWKSNGTKKGTVIIKDLNEGLNGTYPHNLTIVGNKLYFLGYSSTNYNALFVSNGKAGGTHEVNDAGLNGVTISALAAGGNKLYLSGYTYALGTELYTGSDADFAPFVNDVNNSAINRQSFAANIIGNPVQDVLKLSVNTSKQQNAQIVITDVSGKKYVAKSQDLNAGVNLFSYPLNFWPPGIYIVNIIAADNSATQLKFVK